MKSTNDPILDLQQICREKPSSEDELRVGLKSLGWGIPFEEVLAMAQGNFIEKGSDGLYVARDGSVAEMLQKMLKG